MIRKIGFMSSVLIIFTAGGLGYSISELINESKTNIEVVETNENEFSVIINAEKGKEFTAYDIEVVDGQAVVNLMVEGNKKEPR